MFFWGFSTFKKRAFGVFLVKVRCFLRFWVGSPVREIEISDIYLFEVVGNDHFENTREQINAM